MTGDADAATGTDAASEPLECAVCGEAVPRAIYREHLLKACPGNG